MRIGRLVLLVAVALLIPSASPAQIDELQRLPAELAPAGTKQAADSTLRKLRGRLVADRHGRARADGGLRALDTARTATGRLRVTVRLKSGITADLSAIAGAGLEIEHAPAGSPLVQGNIDAADLPRLAGLAAVASVGPLDAPIHRIGSVATEGDSGSGADTVRQQGLDGSGVVVGVISDGIDSFAAAQASGDLGVVTVPLDARCHRGSGDEGTALLEIVHDLAPGAQLLFSGPGSSVEMVDAVRCLTAAGADVIVDDIGFFFEPYFEDGPVAAAVRESVLSGVSYHSAAGNEAEEYYEAEFSSSPGTAHHDFRASNGASVDNTDTIVVPPGEILQCFLQWGDRFGASGNDYDLYLLDASLNIVDAGVDVQSGDGDPLEFVAAVNFSAVDQIVHVVIDRFAGEIRRMKMFCLGGSVPEYVTPTGSIFGHPALAEVVAVGAVDQAEPGRDHVEEFSSRGPFGLLFPAATRAKPDVVALDGVRISNAGGFPLCPPFCRFFGTSAAAPHTAGVAALMLQRAPGLSPGALLTALQEGATDIESPGSDPIAGAGLVNALASVALVSPGTTTSTSTVATSSSTTSLPQTTSSSTPSTSTTLADLSCAQACPDDGDECTTARCEVGIGCSNLAIERAEGVICLLDRLERARLCDSGEISASVATFIGRKTLKAEAHASRTIGATPKRYLVHVRRTLGLLRQLVRKVDAATASGRLKGACRTGIAAALARTVSLAESTTF